MRRILFSIFFVFLLVFPASSGVYWRSPDKKNIALTFDDGPSFFYTGEVLKLLKKENIKATFFVVGAKARSNPLMLDKIAKEGHEIGNHTYTHSRIDWLNDKKLKKEIESTSKYIYEITGKDPLTFRPPHGRFSDQKMKLIEKMGYDVILWSVNADDFYKTKTGMRSPKSIYERVVSRVSGGDVILMHDNSEETLLALKMIIKNLKSRGYKFVTLSQMFSLK